MLGIWKRSVALALGLGLAVFCTPIWAAPPVAQPGALNYIEGQVSIGNQPLTSRAVGSAILNTGDVLSTGNGRAELLLTPGVFMRLGKNSAVRMVSPELTNTRVELLQGEATVEADVLHPEDRILVVERGATTQLIKEGVYDFNADLQVVRVYEGRATVTEGDQHVNLKNDRQVALNQPLKSKKFDRDAVENSDPLYAWSKLRSEYLADATASTSQTYLVQRRSMVWRRLVLESLLGHVLVHPWRRVLLQSVRLRPVLAPVCRTLRRSLLWRPRLLWSPCSSWFDREIRSSGHASRRGIRRRIWRRWVPRRRRRPSLSISGFDK